jgi:putative FmdB family regulatory protein
MPIYEFYCSDCRGKFEVLTSYEKSQAGDMVCATCHGTNVRKLLSVFAKPARAGSGGDDFGGDFGDGDDFGGGSCACGGGGCGCHN